MNGYELSRQFFDFAFENHKCGVYHTAIYMLAIEQNNRYGWKKEFGFPTAYNCDVLGIGNRNTYLSALKDLVDWGFIEIICESKNQFKATIISLCHIKIDIATDTAGYTALDKALIWQDIGHGYAIDTIDKQVNNETSKQANNEKIEISSVPEKIKILKNEYQENITYMKQQAEIINNGMSPDIPDFVQESHKEAWAKFLLYWTSPTKSGKLLCEETKQKSFDIKRRFVTWIGNNISTNSYSQHKKNRICEL